MSLSLEQLKKEIEEMGYVVIIDWFGFMELRFQMIIFQKGISVDRVRMSLSMRGWKIIHETRGEQPFIHLEREGDEIELRDFLQNTSINLRQSLHLKKPE